MRHSREGLINASLSFGAKHGKCRAPISVTWLISTNNFGSLHA